MIGADVVTEESQLLDTITAVTADVCAQRCSKRT